MVKVKVCGISNKEDALVARELGADALGFVFAESPRQVCVEQAADISSALPDDILKVGVFVNAEPEDVLRVAEEVGLDYAQLHGDEGPETIAAIRESGLAVIKALRVRDARSLDRLEDYGADLYLLDSYSVRERGGTGKTFDWGLAKALEGYGNIVVSGGLTPENVREAVEFFYPYGVDASSSLEESPGKKNSERVRRFVGAAKGR